jgi:hypothetical protein
MRTWGDVEDQDRARQEASENSELLIAISRVAIPPWVRSPISKRLNEERLQVLVCGILELAPAFDVTLSALHIPVRHCEFNAAAAKFVLML